MDFFCRAKAMVSLWKGQFYVFTVENLLRCRKPDKLIFGISTSKLESGNLGSAKQHRDLKKRKIIKNIERGAVFSRWAS